MLYTNNLTNKQKVLSIYPNAELERHIKFNKYSIWNGHLRISDSHDSENEAWRNAAIKLNPSLKII